MARFKKGDKVECTYRCNQKLSYPVIGQVYTIRKVHPAGHVELAGVDDNEDCFWTTKQFTLCSRQDPHAVEEEFDTMMEQADSGTGDYVAPLSKQVGGNHYKDYQIQPVTFFIQNAIPFTEASICKYALRHKSKNGKEDLLKAKHLLDILIEEYYPGE